MPRKAKASNTNAPVQCSPRLTLDLNVVLNSTHSNDATGRKKNTRKKQVETDSSVPEVLKRVRKKGDTNKVEKNKKEKVLKIAKALISELEDTRTDLIVGLSSGRAQKKTNTKKDKKTTGVLSKAGKQDKLPKENKKPIKQKPKPKASGTNASKPKNNTTGQSSKVAASNSGKAKPKKKVEQQPGKIKFIPLYSAPELKALRDGHAKKNGFYDEYDDSEFIPYVDRYFKKKQKDITDDDILISEAGYKLLTKMYAEVDKRTPRKNDMIWMITDSDGYEVYEVTEKKLKEYVKELRPAKKEQIDLFKLYAVVEALALFLDGDEDKIWQATDDGERCANFLNTAGSLFVDLLTRLQHANLLAPDTQFRNLESLTGIMLNIGHKWETSFSDYLPWRSQIVRIAEDSGLTGGLRNASGLLEQDALEERVLDDEDEWDVLESVEEYRLCYGPPKFVWMSKDYWYETRKPTGKVICRA